MMASSSNLTITVLGKGGHGSRPHDAIDPVAALALMAGTGVLGAVLVLAADLVGQFAFGARYPVGVITGVVGGPVFLVMLWRRAEWRPVRWLVPAFAAFFGLGLDVRHVTLSTGQLGAALTSLGFGHVGALLVYAHPGIFE